MIVACLVGPSAAQDQPPPAPRVGSGAPATQPSGQVTRIYAVADLLADVPDFVDGPELSDITPRKMEGGGGGGGGGGDGLFGRQPPRPAKTPEQGGEELTALVQSTVAPEAWVPGPDGRPAGTVRLHRGRLVVWGTEAVHRQIQELLTGWRRASAPPIRIRAHWVLADRADLDKVLKPVAGDGGGAAAVLAADPAELDKLPGALAHVRGEVACTSGQRVTVSGVQGRTVVSDLNASVGQNTSSYDPEMSVLDQGLVLGVQGTLADDRQAALVTLASQWKDVRVEPFAPGGAAARTDPATRPAAGALPAGEPLSLLDRTTTRVHELRTSVRLPVGRMVLIGGMTLDPVSGVDGQPPAGGAAAAGVPARPGKSPQLYLFLQVTAG